MDGKWIGALLIVAGCGGFGFTLGANYRLELGLIRDLLRILDHMSCELAYRLTPLPELCRGAADQVRGQLRQLLLCLADQLDGHTSPDVSAAMARSLEEFPSLPEEIRQLLGQLGSSLGRFGLEGQLKGLGSLRGEVKALLDQRNAQREVRIRNYQTLSLCAGAALAILLI